MFQKLLLKHIGGGIANSRPSMVRLLIIMLIMFLIRSGIVMIAYNSVGPKLTANIGGYNFTPLKLKDAMILAILISSLFF
tara:strand:+ start:7449 stop:7688 length:240 start_codon:yes stop_codon:yes gene_type:complete